MQGIIGEMLGQCMLGEYVEWVESVLVWGVVMCVCEMGVYSALRWGRALYCLCSPHGEQVSRRTQDLARDHFTGQSPLTRLALLSVLSIAFWPASLAGAASVAVASGALW